MNTIIPSVLNGTTIAYVLHTDFGDLFEQAYRTSRPLSDSIGYFETYGDGLTQHSGESVATAHHFTDFCLSFAKWLIESPEARDGVHRFYRGMLGLERPNAASVSLLDKIRWKGYDAKREYFSLGQLKVTTADKRNDKRYHEVGTGADGSIQAHLNHYFAGNTGSLHFLRYYTAAHSIRTQIGGHNFEELKLDDVCPGDNSHAWHALMHALDAMDSLSSAANCLRCAIGNTQRQDAHLLAA